jgi:hypothetical protein
MTRATAPVWLIMDGHRLLFLVFTLFIDNLITNFVNTLSIKLNYQSLQSPSCLSQSVSLGKNKKMIFLCVAFLHNVMNKQSGALRNEMNKHTIANSPMIAVATATRA